MGRIAAMNLVETKIEFSNISDKLTEICASKNNNKYDFEVPSNVIEDKEISPVMEPHNHSPIPEITTENLSENLTEQTVPTNNYNPQVQLGIKRNHGIFGELFSKKGDE